MNVFFHCFAVIFFLDVLQIFWGHITFLFLKVQIKKGKVRLFFPLFYECYLGAVLRMFLGQITNKREDKLGMFLPVLRMVFWQLLLRIILQCVVPKQCQKSRDRLRANHARPFPLANEKALALAWLPGLSNMSNLGFV